MSPQEAFWIWFAKNEAVLFEYDLDRDGVFDKIADQLKEIDGRLTFEIGPEQNGTREFIVSAAGIKGAFPAVTALVEAAPKFDRWKVTAFRPRREVIGVVHVGSKNIHPMDVEVILVDNGRDVGVYLFIPCYDEGDSALRQAAYLLLDDALGELDVELKLPLIKMFPIEAKIEGRRFPFLELPQRFDDLINRLSSKH